MSDLIETHTQELPGGFEARIHVYHDNESTPLDWAGDINETRQYTPYERRLKPRNYHTGGIDTYWFSPDNVASQKWRVDNMGESSGVAECKAQREASMVAQMVESWLSDDWHYVGVSIDLYHESTEISSDSLWGIESRPGSDYLDNTIAEMVSGLMLDAQNAIEINLQRASAEIVRLQNIKQALEFSAMVDKLKENGND